MCQAVATWSMGPGRIGGCARVCLYVCVCVVGEADLNIKGSSRKDR